MARLLMMLIAAGWLGQAFPADDQRVFEARDTLALIEDDDADAQQHLTALVWEPEAFEITCTTRNAGDADAVVYFPSPKPAGDEALDRVAMWWYAARDAQGQMIDAPAVVLVHTLHPRMVISRGIARALAAEGLHAFVVQLPGYGLRRDDQWRNAGVAAIEHAAQGVADVRRAADAAAALPHVADGPIALVGTSLGGFVAATAASIDGRFEPVFLVLSGGDAATVMREGRMDARFLRMAMNREGHDDEQIAALLDPVEPLYLAHRLDPAETWLVSASQDTVVPRKCSDALAQRIGLAPDHRVMLNANHYTTSLLLPGIVQMISTTVKDHAAIGAAP